MLENPMIDRETLLAHVEDARIEIECLVDERDLLRSLLAEAIGDECISFDLDRRARVALGWEPSED